jgi:GNAT superfamily N-acetyltransferase
MRINDIITEKVKLSEDASGLDFDLQIDQDTGSFATVTARAHGRILGSVEFFVDGDTLVADQLEVDERYRGQGIAAAMYDYAKSQGYTIQKSPDLTPDGEHFWNKNKGDKTVWEADQINELGNAPAEYTANRKRKNSLFHATVDNQWVDVFFDRSEFNDTLHITFTVNGNYDTPSRPTSASKSTVKILSTVLNVIKQRLPEYIKKSRPPGISFTAKEDNRAGLYRKYFVPVIQDILGAKWAHEEYSSMGMTVFHWRPVRKTMGEELNEISDRLLQNYLSRSDRQISRRLDRMSQARERLNKNYEIYDVNDPARVIDRFEANTPAQAEEYYYKFIKGYNPGDENFEFGVRRSTGITEAFDQPRGIDWEQSEESEAVDAIARLSDGTALTVMFEPEAWTNDSPTDWSVSFWRGNSQEVTGAGNAQEVFATVLSAIRQFVHSHQPESIEFSASKDPEVDMAQPGANVNPESRAKLYDRMVDRYASAMGYQVRQHHRTGQVTYTLRQVKKNVNEDQDYMAGHCHVMAIALKMLHPDWQIRAHVGWEDEAAEDDEYRVDHVYTVAPDGTAYDCRGQFPDEESLVGEDVTGGFETQYADLDLADIQQLVQRGELKRFTREDINKAMRFAKQIGQQGVAEGVLNESAYEEAWELISQPVPEIQQFVKQLGLAQDDTTAKQIAPMIDATPDTQLPAASIPKLKNLANKGNDVQTLKAIQQISGRPDAAQQYAKIMQSRDAGEGRQRGYDVSGLINSVKSGNYEAPVLLKLATGTYVIGGRTRLYAALALGIPAKVKIISVSTFAKQGQQGVAENFADGKNPGRKGLAKRSGVNTKASVSSLRKTAKNSSGEKARMAHWLANMKAGRAKAKRKK